MARKDSQTKPEEAHQGYYIIPVMGPTGSGKSSFINKLLGAEVTQVGHSLSSCTTDLQPIDVPEHIIRQYLPSWHRPDEPPKRLIIVDTPGFDHTTADDSEVLKCIAKWLAEVFGAGSLLAGIIYLHDVGQCRVTGTTNRNFEVFKKLCGPDACKSIVLGTTQWERVSCDERNMVAGREQELHEKFWKAMIARGSTVERVDSNTSSLWKLVGTVLSNRGPGWLQIQEEMVGMKKTLAETDAAMVLVDSFLRVVKPMPSGECRTMQEHLPPIILILGVTGVGKSTFIHRAGPKGKSPEINHGVCSSKAPVDAFEVCNGEQTILLVDTPGFNDTEKSDSTILAEIVSWLASREKDEQIAGIIYLLDITNPEYKPVNVGKLNAPPAVVLATVQCHEGYILPEQQVALEKKYGAVYRGDHFGKTDHHQAAWAIINRVLSHNTYVTVPVVRRNLQEISKQMGSRSIGSDILAVFKHVLRFRST